jgi:toxin ParE1/3/4
MIVYAPRALDDLRAIEAYLHERNPAAARRVLEQIKRTIEMLAVFPLVGIVVNEDGDRRIGVARYPYLVFYHRAEGDVFIDHVRHSARKPIDPETEL